MKILRKITSVILATVFAVSGVAFSASAKAPDTIIPVAVKIKQQPTKLNYFKGTDWDYGYWRFPDEEIIGTFVGDGKTVTFLYNGGIMSYYADRGMLNLNGLVVNVKYSDGTTKDVVYKETRYETYVGQNIMASPEDDYKVETIGIQVYFRGYPKAYDTFYLNVLPYQLGDVDNNGNVSSSDALLVLQHVVGLKTLTSTQKTYADVNEDSKFSSVDALGILRIVVS